VAKSGVSFPIRVAERRGQRCARLPGDDDYVVPMADVGDAQRGQGADHVGGYGYEPIPQEPGPSDDR
jgi:hypothetical protein